MRDLQTRRHHPPLTFDEAKKVGGARALISLSYFFLKKDV